MRFKSLLLTGILVFVLAGVIAATVGRSWWKRPARSAAAVKRGPDLPPASVEYGRLSEQFRVRDSAMDISGTIHIYDEERDGLLKETRRFHFVRVGEKYLSELSSLRTYCDGKLVLVVDTVNREMTVSKYQGNGSRDPFVIQPSPDRLFNDTASLRLTGNVQQQGLERILAVHSDYNPEIRVYRIYYDTASYRAHRMEVEWWKDRRGLDTTGNHIWLAKVDYTYRHRDGIDIGAEMRSFVTVGPEGIKVKTPYADYHLTVNY